MLQWLKVFELQCNNAEFTESFLTHCPTSFPQRKSLAGRTLPYASISSYVNTSCGLGHPELSLPLKTDMPTL